jgi:hypothetical protein
VGWRRFCQSPDGIALERVLRGVEQGTDNVVPEVSQPTGVADQSPIFGLLPGETRRVVIDGVPFDISRDIDDVGEKPT